MEMRELTDGVMPSEVFAAISYDPETREVGVQYGYVLLSLPREDFESFIDLLLEAKERLEGNSKGKRVP
ncbi:MAG: hypothetical protein A2Z21_00270 [Candidatus Fraserbacteria bacterium RBG_16_55_9]|uniref:Uncharacterized protein n=1 Tax=Fraserbacteria sp. (strain RBG_16_55_9) TaxID=1817864 RepID=A0A1F5UNN5_FRAXR|nr:MAG: hypothetical protein A2Z21_00270 [Candidatus Fraserbacteria bacterium RBG_16_55_9]